MSYENCYNSPEKHGLKVIFSNDIAGSYEFDTVVVWKSLTEEKYFWAHDSGCSCPMPFENFNSVEDLTPIEIFNMEQFEQGASGHLESSQIADIRRAVYKAQYGRSQGQTKQSAREQAQAVTIGELTEQNNRLQNEVTELRVSNIALNAKLAAVKKAIGE